MADNKTMLVAIVKTHSLLNEEYVYEHINKCWSNSNSKLVNIFMTLYEELEEVNIAKYYALQERDKGYCEELHLDEVEGVKHSLLKTLFDISLVILGTENIKKLTDDEYSDEFSKE